MHGDHRICFVGDSFVQGTSDPECLGWVGRVCARARQRGIALTGYNLGVRRETSADIAERWQDEVERRLRGDGNQRYLVLSFGVNDCSVDEGARRVTHEQSLRNTRSILEAAKPRQPTLLVGPAPVGSGQDNDRIGRLSRAMGDVAARSGVPYLDVFESLIADVRWSAEVAAGDGSHPSAAGYRKLADLVEAWQHWWFRPGAPV